MIKPQGSFPVFIVRDLDAAKSFYTGHLGFDIVFLGDWYIHLASKSGAQIDFLLPDHPSQPPIFQKQHSGEGVIFSLEVEDADAAYAAARAHSLNIVLDLRSEDWGQRHFCMQDPNGVYLDIVQALEPTEEYRGDYVPG